MESRESMHIKNQISGTSKRNNTLDGATAGNSSAIWTQFLSPYPSSSPLYWPNCNILMDRSFRRVCVILNNSSCLSETTFQNLKAVGSQDGRKQVRQLVDYSTAFKKY